MATKAKTVTKLPAGFTSVPTGGGEFGAWHDFNENEVLQGKIVAIGSFVQQREVTNAKGKKEKISVDVAVMSVQQKDGTIHAVSESAALRGLFKVAKKGRVVYIHFDGYKKLQGGNKVKLFTIGIH